MAESLPIPVRHLDADGRCSFANSLWETLTGAAVPEGGEGWAEAVHPADRERGLASARAGLAAGGPFEVAYRLRFRGGGYRWVDERCAPISDEGGDFLGVLHRRAPTPARRAPAARPGRPGSPGGMSRERSLVIAELRHRMKNVLGLMGGLVGLLARQIPNAYQPLVRELAQRVRAFDLADDALRRARGTKPIDLPRFLGEITEGLRQLAAQRNVAIEVRAEPARITAARVAPLGLLVNELVTNALKHAFPGDRPGRILVEAHQGADGTIELAVSDDGVGLPEEAMPAAETKAATIPVTAPRPNMGLALVTGLVRQAGAETARGRRDPLRRHLPLPHPGHRRLASAGEPLRGAGSSSPLLRRHGVRR